MSETGTDNAPYRIFKFGGSSLGSPKRLLGVVERIVDEHHDGQIAVVVSAMGDTTDWLLDALADAAAGSLETAERAIDRVGDLVIRNAMGVLARIDEAHGGSDVARPNLTPMTREMLAPLRQLLLGVSLLRERTEQATDLVLSFGERLSAAAVASILRALGEPGISVDARSWLLTDDSFGNAVVDWPATRANLETLHASWRGQIPINTGFIGQTADGRTTTLGRNGSDYTATLLGRGLGASEVNICTDVPGVMTGDPLIVDDAYPVPRLSYMEALELANYGARMFHPRTMLPLIASGIPMRIRPTMSPEDPGTIIDAGPAAGATNDDTDVGEKRGPTSVTSLENLALLDMRSRQLATPARMGRRVLEAIDELGIPVWMASQSAHGQAVSLVIPVQHVDEARDAIEDTLALELERGLVEPLAVEAPVTLLSLVAERMRDREEVAGRFFATLGAIGVNTLAIAQSGSTRSISCVIPDADTRTAVRTVHAAFNFAHQEVSLAVLGKGVVGAELLDQISSQQAALERDHDVAIRLVALADSRHIVVDSGGLDVEHAATWLADEAGAASDVPETLARVDNTPSAIDEVLETLRKLPTPVLVDATAAGGNHELFERALAGGVHVVSANKKPFTVDIDAYRGLRAAARRSHRGLHYETTVGASLPVIETLKNVLRTGDRVHRIEGALSGTLGYLCNEAMAGVPLSDAVAKAVELGYAEPQPQDDLSGVDVARKGLILARELGFSLDLDDVAVEPLVPASLLDTDGLEPFLDALRDYDETFSAQIERYRSENRVLRYLAIIDPGLEPASGTDGDGRGERASVEVKVGPVAVPADHPSTRLRGAEAFVGFVTDRYREYPLIVQGPGAGGAVTAAGVLADVLRIAQTLRGL